MPSSVTNVATPNSIWPPGCPLERLIPARTPRQTRPEALRKCTVDLRRSKVRSSRALGVALTPKAARVMERRPTRPGQHGRGRIKDTDYKARLLEKQRLSA
nr:hypothetical protein [Actinoallomurus iriomotensis]